MQKLLIIDNEEFDREIARKLFKDTYNLSFCTSAFDLGRIVSEIKPDITLYEMRKNDIKDLSLVFSTIEEHSPHMPIIVVISENTLEIETQARILGAYYILIRPFNLKELWDALESAFGYVKHGHTHAATTAMEGL